MATTQYVGARYVPLFADPAEWSNANAYEPLTIVVHEGNSYTSKMAVPKGVDISNEKYWALTGNYNAQVEEYRKEVKTFGTQIDDNTAAIKAETTRAESTETSLVEKIEKEIEDREYADTELKTHISDNAQSITNITTTKPKILVFGDSFSTYNYGGWTKFITEYDVLNYAQGGAGAIGNSGGTYKQQLDKALQEISKDTVFYIKKCIVYGGINDETYTAENIANAIIDFDTAYKNSILASVPYVIVTSNIGLAPYPSNTKRWNGMPKLVNDVCKILAANSIPYIDNAHRWLAAYFTDAERKALFTGDNIHPSDAGFKIIAGYMKQIIQGIKPHIHNEVRATFNNGAGELLFSQDEGTLTIEGSMNNMSGLLKLDSNSFPIVNEIGVCVISAFRGTTGTSGGTVPIALYNDSLTTNVIEGLSWWLAEPESYSLYINSTLPTM